MDCITMDYEELYIEPVLLTELDDSVAPDPNAPVFAWRYSAEEAHELTTRAEQIKAAREFLFPTTRLGQLKKMLSDTDYVAAKIAEGAATKEEYADMIAKREVWREEIREIEGAGVQEE